MHHAIHLDRRPWSLGRRHQLGWCRHLRPLGRRHHLTLWARPVWPMAAMQEHLPELGHGVGTVPVPLQLAEDPHLAHLPRPACTMHSSAAWCACTEVSRRRPPPGRPHIVTHVRAGCHALGAATAARACSASSSFPFRPPRAATTWPGSAAAGPPSAMTPPAALACPTGPPCPPPCQTRLTRWWGAPGGGRTASLPPLTWLPDTGRG
jgi:hypothetical protein